jgi:hypothetical protein
VRQRPVESLHSFIQRFSQVRNTIPCISNASVVVVFRQSVRDEKMLEKLTTHDIQDVTELFSLADKCASRGSCLACPAYSKSGEGCQARSERYCLGRWQKEQREEEEGWWQ